MARIAVSRAWVDDPVDLPALFRGLDPEPAIADPGLLVLSVAGPDGSVWTVSFRGTGFVYARGTPLSGALERVEIADGEGSVLARMTGLSKDLGDVFHYLRGGGGASAAFEFLINGDDVYRGSKLADVIRGFVGDDRLRGKGGNDYIEPGAGRDTVEGGEGFDVLSYQDASNTPHALRGVEVDAQALSARDPWGSTDTFASIEGFFGTNFGDVLLGSGAAFQVFNPLRGNDLVDGGAGIDRLDYSSEHKSGGREGILADLAAGTVRDTFGTADTVSSIEEVRGSRYADSIAGDARDNRLQGLKGRDTLDGRAGIDEASYADDALFGGDVGVVVDLDAGDGGGVATDGFGSRDRLLAIENATGTAQADRLTGSGASNYLAGLDGRDTIDGGRGDDRILGGAGKDVMRGGEGADVFVFANEDEPTVVKGRRDAILDFARGLDLVDLEAVDADRGKEGDDPFAFIGIAVFSGVAGELRYARMPGGVVLQTDRDGDRRSDYEIELRGIDAVDSGDILL